MRGVAYSPDFKALLMGLDQQGESLSALSRRHQVAPRAVVALVPAGATGRFNDCSKSMAKVAI